MDRIHGLDKQQFMNTENNTLLIYIKPLSLNCSLFPLTCKIKLLFKIKNFIMKLNIISRFCICLQPLKRLVGKILIIKQEAVFGAEIKRMLGQKS